MNTVVVCPATIHLVFVPSADGDAAVPQLPFACPGCGAVVAAPGDHPAGPSVDDLIAFPYLLRGEGEALLAEAGARYRSAGLAAAA